MTRSRRGVVAKEAWGGATRDGATWGRNYVNGAWAERRCQGDAEPRDAVQRVGRCYADVIWHGRGDVPKETVRRATRGRATCGMGYVDRRVYGRGNITKETLRRETLDAVTLTVTCRGANLTGRRGAGRRAEEGRQAPGRVPAEVGRTRPRYFTHPAEGGVGNGLEGQGRRTVGDF